MLLPRPLNLLGVTRRTTITLGPDLTLLAHLLEIVIPIRTYESEEAVFGIAVVEDGECDGE